MCHIVLTVGNTACRLSVRSRLYRTPDCCSRASSATGSGHVWYIQIASQHQPACIHDARFAARSMLQPCFAEASRYAWGQFWSSMACLFLGFWVCFDIRKLFCAEKKVVLLSVTTCRASRVPCTQHVSGFWTIAVVEGHAVQQAELASRRLTVSKYCCSSFLQKRVASTALETV